MVPRVFLDADVLLQFTLKESGYEHPRQVMEWAIKGWIQVFTSSAIIRDIAIGLNRAYGPTQTQKILSALVASAQVIDAEFQTIVIALQSRIDSVAAAISYYTALQHRMDYFLTYDFMLFQNVNPVLPATTPIDFFNRHAPTPERINRLWHGSWR